jgi:hypothetical protein
MMMNYHHLHYLRIKHIVLTYKRNETKNMTVVISLHYGTVVYYSIVTKSVVEDCFNIHSGEAGCSLEDVERGR